MTDEMVSSRFVLIGHTEDSLARPQMSVHPH